MSAQRPGLAPLVLFALAAHLCVGAVLASDPVAGDRVAGDRRPAPRIVRITHSQGLSDDTVEAIVEDHLGFLWFGTQDGLNRYDGYSFTVYRHEPADSRSLSRSFVSVLYEDRGGNLWVGTQVGLNRYDRESDTFVRYLHDADDEQTLSNDTIYSLYEDRAGDLWVGTYWGLNRLQRESGTFVRYAPEAPDPRDRLEAHHVRAILEDRQGFLWVGTEGDGLFRMDLKQGSSEHYHHDPADPLSLSHDEVWDLLEDRRGRLWIGTRGGLDRLDAKAGAFLHFAHDPDNPKSPGGDHVDDLLEDRGGQLWIGYDGAGLDRFDEDEARGSFAHFRHAASESSSLSADVVRTIYEDRQGDLWVGTYTGGVSHLNQDNPFFHDGHRDGDPNSLSHNAVLSFLEDADGSLWIGTEGGLNHYDPRADRFRAYVHDEKDPGSLSADAVLSIVRDRRGDLWVGTFFGGLNRLEPEDGTFVHYQPRADDPVSLGNPHVWDIREDREGRLWLATFDGVDRFDPETETFSHYRHDANDPESIGNAFVWKIYEDRSGTLWVATQGGLSSYDPGRDAFRTYGSASGLLAQEVLTIFERRQGFLWLGIQGGGLARFERESETFTLYGADAGLPGGIVYCILGDDEGLLWLSTSDGLSEFDPQTESFVNYDESDGVLAKPFAKNACLRSQSGELLFGGSHGVISFFPEAVGANARQPPIVLTDFLVFNRPVAIGGPDAPLKRHISVAETIRLRHDKSVMSISYAALNYRAPHRNQYMYKLDGFDQEWNRVGNQRTATYTNLDPGRYTFRVKGSNNSGLWNEEGAAIRLTIEPPLWRTWWAYGLYGLTLSAMVLGYVAAQKRKVERERAISRRLREVDKLKDEFLEERERLIHELEARNAELARFNYTVSHDLKNPIVTIRNFLGLVRRNAAAGETEDLERNFDRLERAAKTMHRQLDMLYEYSRLDREARPLGEVQLGDLVREVSDELAESIEARRIEVRVAPDLPTVRGDGARLLEMLRHLLGNAVTHLGDQASPRIEVGVFTAETRPCGRLGEGTERSAGAPVFYVRDNGRGIEPRYHERIFRLFERLDPQASEGTGIGLALAQRIAEVHGGRVWVESEGRGHGSTFCFTLPGAVDRPRRDSTREVDELESVG